MIQQTLALIIKELIGIWRDPKSRFSLLGPPIIQLLIFTFAATLDVKNVSIGILNKDNGEKGFELVEKFYGTPTFTHIHHLSSTDAIKPFMDEQKGIMVLTIDEQFSRDLEAKKLTSVQLILDGRKANASQIVTGYTNTIINQFNDEISIDEGVAQPNVKIVPRNWYNPNLLYYWFTIPSLVATLAMLTCLIVTSISVARERELGTFDQLLVSPLSPRQILIGKIAPGVIVGMVEGTIMLIAGVFLFQLPFTGSLLLFFLSLFIFIASISGAGLFISALSSTQQQAMLGAFIFIVPSIILSGFATPVENMPTWLSPVSYLMPLRYMLIISKGLFLKAMPMKTVFSNLWPMMIIGLFTLIGSGIFFRKRLE